MRLISKLKHTVFILPILLGVQCSTHKVYHWDKDDDFLRDEIFDNLCKKSNYGTNRDALNDYEKVVWVVLRLEMEVNNGGFDQFFFNTDDRWNDILVSSMKAIKAWNVAELCEKAIAIEAKQLDLDEQLELLNECDNAFYDSTDNLTALSLQYAKENKKHFKY